MNIVDIALIVVIAVIAIISAKKGFLMTIFNIAAYAIAGVASKLFSSPVGAYVYENFFSAKILNKLEELMPSGSVEGEVSTVVTNAVESLPEYIQALIYRFDVVSFMNEQAPQTEALTVDVLESMYLAPAVTNVLSIVSSVVLFALFLFVSRLIFGLINKSLTDKKHKVVKGTNTFFGAAFGVVKGTAIAALFAAVFNIAAPGVNNESLTELVNGSIICNMVAEILK